jgi:hypothetical protein
VVGLDAEGQRGDHGHSLLARDVPRVRVQLDELVEGLELVGAPQRAPVHGKLVGPGVPVQPPQGLHGHAVHHAGLAGVALHLLDYAVGEVAVHVDAEGRGQRDGQARHEGVPLLRRHDVLRAIVRLEHRRARLHVRARVWQVDPPVALGPLPPEPLLGPLAFPLPGPLLAPPHSLILQEGETR